MGVRTVVSARKCSPFLLVDDCLVPPYKPTSRTIRTVTIRVFDSRLKTPANPTARPFTGGLSQKQVFFTTPLWRNG
jgi:hypothetical protein